MAFNSVHFLVFFPIVTVLYFVISHRYRWVWLLLCSYYFYMSWTPKYAILMGISSAVTYLSGLLIEKADNIRDARKSIYLKKVWVFLSFSINLGILILFKYYDFFRTGLVQAFSWLDISFRLPPFNFLLPVGISFYTFQALSYTVDVYRKDVPAEKNVGKYFLFVSFFPQLVAGPIEKSKNLLYQFNELHDFDYDRVKNGLILMLWGLFQKVLVADRLAILVNTVYNNPDNYKGFEIIIATVFFAFQIYCDFSAYSDIARGAAEVMGFRLTKNFEQPYFSKSIKEFWRRWHITLGQWFKDYLYIPLGGNRCGRLRKYFNLMVVFIISGLWHGAGLNFIIWGALHGFYQVTGDMLRPLKEKTGKILWARMDAFNHKFFQAGMTFLLVNFAWIFFRANSFSDSITLVKNIWVWNPWIFAQGTVFNLGLDAKDFLVAILGIATVLIVNCMQRRINIRLQLSEQNVAFRWAVYLIAVVSIIIFGVYAPGYEPQQFIYFQF